MFPAISDPLLKLPKTNKSEKPHSLFAFSCSSEACLPFPFVFDFLQTSKPHQEISPGCRRYLLWVRGQLPSQPPAPRLPLPNSPQCPTWGAEAASSSGWHKAPRSSVLEHRGLPGSVLVLGAWASPQGRQQFCIILVNLLKIRPLP